MNTSYTTNLFESVMYNDDKEFIHILKKIKLTPDPAIKSVKKVQPKITMFVPKNSTSRIESKIEIVTSGPKKRKANTLTHDDNDSEEQKAPL